VDEQHKQESQLQTAFANLVAKKAELLQIWTAKQNGTAAVPSNEEKAQQPAALSEKMETDVTEGEAPVSAQHS